MAASVDFKAKKISLKGGKKYLYCSQTTFTYFKTSIKTEEW